jgi:hypothetical protein
MRRRFAARAAFVAALTIGTRAMAATIIATSIDDPGEGFNDPTAASPIGGNTGTTLGQQRLGRASPQLRPHPRDGCLRPAALRE